MHIRWTGNSTRPEVTSFSLVIPGYYEHAEFAKGAIVDVANDAFARDLVKRDDFEAATPAEVAAIDKARADAAAKAEAERIAREAEALKKGQK